MKFSSKSVQRRIIDFTISTSVLEPAQECQEEFSSTFWFSQECRIKNIVQIWFCKVPEQSSYLCRQFYRATQSLADVVAIASKVRTKFHILKAWTSEVKIFLSNEIGIWKVATESSWLGLSDFDFCADNTTLIIGDCRMREEANHLDKSGSLIGEHISGWEVLQSQSDWTLQWISIPLWCVRPSWTASWDSGARTMILELLGRCEEKKYYSKEPSAW